MTIGILDDVRTRVSSYLAASNVAPLLLLGDALDVLAQFPAASVDFCMTSPPYWAKREYENGGIGLETNYTDYIERLLDILSQVKRALKPTGSLWLNIGDSYLNKGLVGIPWRIALRLVDEQGWILRNSVIWHKVKGGMDNSRDRLANNHENLFHFVQDANHYYYNLDAIRAAPRRAQVVNGAVISATGVTGVRYKRQIEMSTALSDAEKAEALASLEKMLDRVRLHEIQDFRMIIRGQQRATHSDSSQVSGRARELRDKGFYFLCYHPQGSKPGDVWDILPEDTQKRGLHFAPYPEDLCKLPILASCPPDGVVLDPFCGTGTTLAVAQKLGRKSIGIDISPEYLTLAEQRCWRLL